MQRIAQIISVKPESIDEYERIHRAVWPEVLSTIAACNIRNYSIFRLGTTLFAYFEYHGDNYPEDMARMAADAKTQEWWKITNPMQTPVAEHGADDWWTRALEVFHVD